VKEEKDWKANTLNARNDELFFKMPYRDSWMNTCLVICTGFFEPMIGNSSVRKNQTGFLSDDGTLLL